MATLTESAARDEERFELLYHMVGSSPRLKRERTFTDLVADRSNRLAAKVKHLGYRTFVYALEYSSVKPCRGLPEITSAAPRLVDIFIEYGVSSLYVARWYTFVRYEMRFHAEKNLFKVLKVDCYSCGYFTSCGIVPTTDVRQNLSKTMEACVVGGHTYSSNVYKMLIEADF